MVRKLLNIHNSVEIIEGDEDFIRRFKTRSINLTTTQKHHYELTHQINRNFIQNTNIPELRTLICGNEEQGKNSTGV